MALPMLGATSNVSGRPVMRAMCSIQASSSALSRWSEMISIVPWPTPAKASAMATISSPDALVPGTTLPALSMWP